MENNLSAKNKLAGEMHVAISNAMGGSWKSADVGSPATAKDGPS